MTEQRRRVLPSGARLDGDEYEIDEVLGAGGFGWSTGFATGFEARQLQSGRNV